MSVLILCGADILPESSAAISCTGRLFQPGNGLCARFIEALKPEIEDLEFFENVTQLIARFRQPRVSPAALILVIDGLDTVEALISDRDLFDGIPIIAVLTGEDPQTLRRTHTLGPRYIGHDSGDLTDVAAVLVNLTAQYL